MEMRSPFFPYFFLCSLQGFGRCFYPLCHTIYDLYFLWSNCIILYINRAGFHPMDINGKSFTVACIAVRYDTLHSVGGYSSCS